MRNRWKDFLILYNIEVSSINGDENILYFGFKFSSATRILKCPLKMGTRTNPLFFLFALVDNIEVSSINGDEN